MALGCRVVRGPDWEWADQDGGEGCVGTVVQVKQDETDAIEGTVWVQWDTGARANYRAGLNGKTDLRVYDSSATGKIVWNHGFAFICDGCSQSPVVGMLWLCMKCDNYGLCTSCYMSDTHDLDCPFKRIDGLNRERSPVGKREGATKIQAKGTFTGARVVRGPDWSWGQQDGGKGGQGTVVEMKDWKNGAKGAVSVKWDKSNENIYRLGVGGKVDVTSITSETGGFYYRDHLPALKVRSKKTVNGFTTGDSVRVNVTKEQLMKMAEVHGGWHPDMEKFIPMIGVVHDFTKSGDVIVDYNGVQWRFAQQAITKLRQFKTGDKVLVSSDKELVMKLQEGHGGWNPKMKTMLGMIGTVKKSHPDNNALIVVGGNIWLVNSAILTLHEAAKEKEDSDDDDDDDDNDMNNPLESFLKQQVTLQKLLTDAFTEMFTGGNQGNSSEKQDDDEGLALVQAASHGHVSRVTQTLDARPELVNYFSPLLGKTCLHMACHSGYCDIIKLLLDKNADTSIKDGQGYTAIHHAAYGDKSGEALKLMLAHGVDPNIANNDVKCTPLHLAVRESNDNGVRILVQADNCDVNLQDEGGETPLHDAIIRRNNTIVDLILEAPKLNLALFNKNGFNFLHLAAYKGNSHAARKLLSKSPELVNVPKEDGFTPLHLAAVNDHCEIAEMIIEQPDCKIDCLTKNKQTPLMLAVHEGYLKMVQILEQHGADVNATDDDGDTPLHVSLMREKFFSAGMGKMLGLLGNNGSSYLEISRYLISHGANVRQANQGGKTPMEYGQGTKAEQDLRKAFEETKTKEKEKETKNGTRNIINNFGTNKADEGTSQDKQASEPMQTDQQVTNSQRETHSTDEFENTKTADELNETLRQIPKALVVKPEGKSVENSEGCKETDTEKGDEEHRFENSMDEEEEFQNSASYKAVKEDDAPIKKTKMTCLICVDAEADIVFKPCGHTVLCKGCSVRAKRCPQCKELVTNKTTEDGKSLPPKNKQEEEADTKEKLQSAEKRLKKLEEMVTCCVCMDRKKNIIFSCGHGACQVCAEHLGVCAICKKEIQRKIAMF